VSYREIKEFREDWLPELPNLPVNKFSGRKLGSPISLISL